MATNGMRPLLFLIISTSTISCIKVLEEPVCTSRFDFESGLVREMMKLEYEMAQLKDRTNLALTKLEAKLDDGIKDFETKLQAIEAQAVKPPVAFLAHTVSDRSPGTNTKLTFTVAVTNTGDAYDTSTGVFTAPVNGIYWFSVQICPASNKYMQVQIYAETKVIGSSLMYGNSGNIPCYTTSAVSVLTAGNNVFVKSGVGGYVSPGVIIYNDNVRWSFFSGALV